MFILKNMFPALLYVDKTLILFTITNDCVHPFGKQTEKLL